MMKLLAILIGTGYDAHLMLNDRDILVHGSTSKDFALHGLEAVVKSFGVGTVKRRIEVGRAFGYVYESLA